MVSSYSYTIPSHLCFFVCRTLSSAACIISEKKNVHHSIISGLDSHDEVEYIAAIYAANRFAAVSKSFAVSIYDKLAEMIENLETPVDMKVKLIAIFQHMHHDPATTLKVCLLHQNYSILVINSFFCH